MERYIEGETDKETERDREGKTKRRRRASSETGRQANRQTDKMNNFRKREREKAKEIHREGGLREGGGGMRERERGGQTDSVRQREKVQQPE